MANVWILVIVEKMPFVELLNIAQCALVHKIIKEILIPLAMLLAVHGTQIVF